MAGTIRIGDCLMLSQSAWRCGRAFSSTNNTPSEFRDVEHELARLAKSLKLLAECLFAEDTEILLGLAESFTKAGIAMVIDYTRHTLSNLESLVEQYQSVKKTGFLVEKGWSDVVLSTYKDLMWTIDGGSIYILRDMLHMHVSTTAVVRQALDSKSRDRVEWTIAPMAERIQAMYTQPGRDAGESIEGIERVVQSLMDQSPALVGAFDRVNSFGSDLSLLNGGSASPTRGPSSRTSGPSRSGTPSMLSMESHPEDIQFPMPRAIPIPPPRSSSRAIPEIRTREIRPRTSHVPSHTSSYHSASTSPGAFSGSELSPSEQGMWENASSVGLPSPAYPVPMKSPKRGFKPPDFRAVAGKSLPAIPNASSSKQRREEAAKSMPAQVYTTPPTPPESDVERAPSHRRQRSKSDYAPIQLPPAAWEDDNATIREPETGKYTTIPQQDQEAIMLGRHMSTISQQETFERGVFKNSAIYCDLRGKLVQFVLPSKDERRPHETQIEEGMTDCRICLVRRREAYGNGESRFSTSIWAFSDDRTVRLQQILPDGAEIIPFSSYFQDEKVSVTVKTELTFHDLTFGAPPSRRETSKWVNYVFEDDQAAITFQNALFGKTLMDTFKTEKTTRLRDGFTGALAYEEQMCAMENLRLWSEEPSGAVTAMLHYSAAFRNGYLQFVVNDRDRPIKVKDDGARCVKVRGLRILDGEYPEEVARGKKEFGGKKEKGVKYITGAKVEFKNEAEKYKFLLCVRELQISAVSNRQRSWS